MANKKQKKAKERERRVAKKKLEAAAKRRQEEQTSNETNQAKPKKSIYSKTATPQASQVANTNQKSFTQRRSGG